MSKNKREICEFEIDTRNLFCLRSNLSNDNKISAERPGLKTGQGHPMDLFLKISVLQAHFCWLGDVEEIIVLGRKVLLKKDNSECQRGFEV